MVKNAILIKIENEHKIRKDTDCEFLYSLQCGMLLALKEQGRLNEMQFRNAEMKLRQQQRVYMKKLQQKGSGSV
ncbi:MAG: hypothetical protein IJX71_02340 [Oscillospiraceae bacterium]|nr:hypothetical protein [Oscillospiraceae bacterium]